MLAKLEAGEPLTVPRCYIGGNSFPSARSIPWLADPYSGVRAMLVDPSDAVTPLYD